MSKLVVTILKISNVFFAVLYLAACLIPVLPAGKFWMIAVVGLVFPLLFLLLAAFFFLWLIARSKWCLLSLTAILLSWQQLSVIAGLNTRQPFNVTKPAETLRVLSWNISSWGETNKSKTSGIKYKPLSMALILQQQADVVCLQEFFDHRNPQSNSVLAEFKEMGYPHSYFVRSFLENRLDRTGVVILSKHPIVDTAQYYYGENDYAEHLIYADILFNGQKIRVFTTHLQSVRFEQEQYTALRKIKQTDKSGLKDSRTIVRKLKNAYGFRGQEADLVRAKIQESPHPVIICGDFNDVPNSYSYFTIRGDLQDAFVKKGTGLGRTFQYLSPTLRIDYILADKQFEVTQFNRIRAPYSDHYPVITDLKLK